jgi:hypothetical protein
MRSRIVFLCCLFLLIAPLVVAGSVEGDWQALMDIYEVTDGDNWVTNQGWGGSPSSMGDWYGIETDSSGRVVRVELEANNLVNSRVVGYDRNDFEILELIPGREFPESVRNLKRVEYFSVKGNQITGPVPEGFMHMTSLHTLMLSGRVGQEPEYNSENHPGKARVFDKKNHWLGPLPQDWSRLTNLWAVVISHHQQEHGMSGPLPKSLFDLPNIEFIILYGNQFTGTIPEIANAHNSKIVFISVQDSNLEGPLPESWSELSAPYGKYFRFSGNQGLSGSIPESYANIDNIRIFYAHGTDLVGFPTFLLHDGNSRLNYFSPPDNLPDGLPETIPAQSTTFPHMSIFTLKRLGVPGVIPNWVSRIRLVQFNFDDNEFSALADGFYVPDIRAFWRVRNVRWNDNNLLGELPDSVFTRISSSGDVRSTPSSSVVEIGGDVGVVESGTIDEAGSNWIRDRDKIGVWDSSWAYHEVTILVPGGENIVFITRSSSTNVDRGYIYSGDGTVVSGTAGYDYEIRPQISDSLIRFQLAENSYLTRKVVSSDSSSNTVTLDKPLEVDVTGLPYYIHTEQSAVWLGHFHGNRFYGSIPQSYGYIPTDRELELRFTSNDLSGLIPDLSMVGVGWGGHLEILRFNHNRFVFRDIIPNFAVNREATQGSFRYAPQRPFGPAPWGEQRIVRAEQGSSLVYDELASYVSHPDNVYRWEKDGSSLSGQTSVALSINDFSSSDEGMYRLRVTNQNIPDLVLYSEDILFEVGVPEEPDEVSDPLGLVLRLGVGDSGLVDVSGLGQEVVPVGSVSWVSDDLFGSALLFGGSGDYLRVSSSSSLRVGDSFTLAAWVRPSDVSGDGDFGIISKAHEPDSNVERYHLGVTRDGRVDVRRFSSSLVSFRSSVGDVVDGRWYHLAGVYDGSRLRMYVNGEEVSSVAASGDVAFSARDLLVGKRYNDRFFSGRMADVQVWDVALSGAEINDLMEGVDLSDEEFDPSDYAAPRSGFSVDDRVHVVDTAVFDTGYYSVDGRVWTQFSLSGETVGDWVVGEAESAPVPSDARFFAAFSCSWSDSWVCEDTWQVLER